MMKSVTRTKYGSSEVLSIQGLDIPLPKDDEVLIKIFAATVNRTDCAILSGTPFIMRLVVGLFTPKLRITGTDFAGSIEAVGKEVTEFKVGDRVFGFDDMGISSHAQYMVVSVKKAIIKIPSDISYEEAAASSEAAHYAYNCLNKVKLKAGQEALVNGATGGIGSALVQFLKYFAVNVTAVCDTKNIELIKSLGADRIIDYTKVDFTKDAHTYDYVFDAVGKSSFGKCKPLLEKKGIYISSELGRMSQNIFLALLTPLFAGKKVIFPVPVNIKASLEFIKSLLEIKKFKPVIDRKYSLENIASAYDYVASGQKIGNVIITMWD